jgi:hypothetical protein
MNQCRAFNSLSRTSRRRTRMRMESVRMERTNERMNESIYRLCACAFLPLSLPSHASSVARVVRRSSRNAVASSSRSTFGSVQKRFRRRAKVPRRRFSTRSGFSLSLGWVRARACVFFPIGWVGVRSVWGVCVFSLRAFNAREQTARAGWMDGWCERKGLIRKVTTTDACGMNLYSSVMLI